jgi:rhomboid protease GluP
MPLDRLMRSRDQPLSRSCCSVLVEVISVCKLTVWPYTIRFKEGWPLSTFPMPDESTATDGSRVYSGRPGTQLRQGALLILLSLLGLIPLKAMYGWHHGGPMPEPRAFMAAGCVLFLPFGALLILNAIRGLPRLTVKPDGITLQQGLSTKWANWDSLDPFVVKITQAGRRKVKTASAKITGTNASTSRSRAIRIPDFFKVPVDDIVADLNTVRASYLGISEASAHMVTIPEPAPVGLRGFVLPWLTFALLGVLICIFILENKFPVTPGAKLAPSVQTLFAMGALNSAAVLSDGEWYRLFTAPLLHANLAHILGNGVALLFGGWLLERLVGRLWYFAFFAIGALGGSLVSLAIWPAGQISVGASGALMGLFAGLFVSSFRLASGTSARTRLQLNSLRILIPALLPSFSKSTGVHIDYGAHFGGALAGAALAFVLLKSWPEGASIPQRRRAAAIITGAGIMLFVGSAGMAVANYPKYDVALIPQSELPKTAAESREHAASLAASYPDDPRSHLYLGHALAEAKDYTGAERELRLALTTAEAHPAVVGAQQALISRGVLALFLTEQGRQDEAKTIARQTCLASEDAGITTFVKMLTAQHLCE